MLKTVWDFILRLFGIHKTATTNEQMKNNSDYAARYEDISNINFTAIFANKLTTLAVSESTGDIVGENARVEYLDECLESVWSKLKKITARMLGTGGCALVPYVKGGNLFFDIVSQDRILINEKQGERIISATILAESIKLKEVVYYRWVDYKVAENTLYITNKVTTISGAVAEVEQWKNIEDRAITGVDRVLFAFFKSPVDNRSSDDYYGVPITYGCDSIMEDIRECLKQIVDEFKLKEVRVFADDRMFKKDQRTGEYKIPSKLFFAAHGTEQESMIEIFSPDIRDSSYYNRLLNLFDLLEKSVGTSKGILTAPESRGATATEIKAGLYDTYAMVTDIRSAIERGIEDYIYACNVLINYYGLAPQGDYEIAFDWSYSLVESSMESWAQMKDALSMGIKSKAEVRQWLNPNETIDEAQEKVDEIRKNEPTVKDLLGAGGLVAE